MLPRTAEQINGKLSTEVSRNGHAVRDQLRALQVAFRSHQAPAFPDATAAEAFLNQYAPHLDPKFEGNARIAYIKDYGGRYLFANRTWESVNGQPWFGKTDRELWPKPVASELRAIDARVLNENRVCQSLVTIDTTAATVVGSLPSFRLMSTIRETNSSAESQLKSSTRNTLRRN